VPSLKELQTAFKRNVVKGDEAFGEYIISTEAVSSDVRLDIYSNAYFARLQEALESDYEILKQLLGEDVFEEACLAYIHKYPSHYFSLRWFGQDFPVFLGYAPDSGEHHWPAEMAQLEWSFVGAFDAADAEPLGEAHAAAIPPEAWASLKIAFHPSVRTMTVWWNTLLRWRTAKHNETVPKPVRLPQATQCLLWRNALITQYRSLEPDEAVALQAALEGADFSALCGALAEEIQDQEQIPMKAAGFLKTWLAAGMIVGFDY